MWEKNEFLLKKMPSSAVTPVIRGLDAAFFLNSSIDSGKKSPSMYGVVSEHALILKLTLCVVGRGHYAVRIASNRYIATSDCMAAP